VHPLLRASAQMLTPRASAGMTVSMTLSRHCFMAPGEAVELGGYRNNSLAADNTPGDALAGVRDACAAVCCRMLPCGVHSSSAWHWAIGNLRCGGSSFSLHRKIHRSLSAVLNDLHHHSWTRKASKNLMPWPLPDAPNVGEQISDQVVECTRPKS
jgi:hypothetical protein